MKETKVQENYFLKSEKLRTVRWLSELLDSRFKIPGTNIRFGLDPIISFFPIAGDIATSIVSLAMVNTMARHGASKKLILRMLINVGIDLTIGSIPALGTIFDIYYKSNQRNVRLLREYYEEGKHRGTSRWILLGILLTILLIFSLIIYGIYLLISLAFN